MVAYDRAMIHLDKAFGYIAAPHQWVSRQDNADKVRNGWVSSQDNAEKTKLNEGHKPVSCVRFFPAVLESPFPASPLDQVLARMAPP